MTVTYDFAGKTAFVTGTMTTRADPESPAVG